ncbi:MAG: hypothetical protein QXI58_00020 [Candidatus Micrarchaeia archaeon]|jgi:hypothetical protein
MLKIACEGLDTVGSIASNRIQLEEIEQNGDISDKLLKLLELLKFKIRDITGLEDAPIRIRMFIAKEQIDNFTRGFALVCYNGKCALIPIAYNEYQSDNEPDIVINDKKEILPFETGIKQLVCSC